MLKYCALSIGCLVYDTIKGDSVLLQIGILISGEIKSAVPPFPFPYCLLFLFLISGFGVIGSRSAHIDQGKESY